MPVTRGSQSPSITCQRRTPSFAIYEGTILHARLQLHAALSVSLSLSFHLYTTIHSTGTYQKLNGTAATASNWSFLCTCGCNKPALLFGPARTLWSFSCMYTYISTPSIVFPSLAPSFTRIKRLDSRALSHSFLFHYARFVSMIFLYCRDALYTALFRSIRTYEVRAFECMYREGWVRRDYDDQVYDCWWERRMKEKKNSFEKFTREREF